MKESYLKPRSIVFIALMLLIIFNIQGQQTYRTSDGVIRITTALNNLPFVIQSNQLNIILNYETAEFLIKLDKSTLETGIDTIDQKFKSLKDEFVLYEGKLGIEYVPTKSHPEMNFNVEGRLIGVNHKDFISGDGHLLHVLGGDNTCILSLSFFINLSELNFDIELQNLEDEVQIEIVQSVLERAEN